MLLLPVQAQTGDVSWKSRRRWNTRHLAPTANCVDQPPPEPSVLPEGLVLKTDDLCRCMTPCVYLGRVHIGGASGAPGGPWNELDDADKRALKYYCSRSLLFFEAVHDGTAYSWDTLEVRPLRKSDYARCIHDWDVVGYADQEWTLPIVEPLRLEGYGSRHDRRAGCWFAAAAPITFWWTPSAVTLVDSGATEREWLYQALADGLGAAMPAAGEPHTLHLTVHAKRWCRKVTEQSTDYWLPVGPEESSHLFGYGRVF